MIEIIPAIDIIDGKCVRLQQGDYGKKTVYNENPVEVAKSFEDVGIKRLHLVDLDGAKAKHVVNLQVLGNICKNTKLTVDFGGGIKSDEDIKQVFENGASFATIGSIAVENKCLFEKWQDMYGNSRLILGADIMDMKIAISGWMEVTDIDLFQFLAGFQGMGIEYVLCTDISKDGMLEGTALEMYKAIQSNFPNLKLIASGGITSINEIEKLNEMGVYGVIIGKAIYENRISLNDLKMFL